jgi:MoaA/NifB/PqqE/SkfB family radical SAM enzyme
MSQVFDPNPEFLAAPQPRVLWIELTSKCPFDCIFCSRALRRGSGEDLEFNLLQQVLNDLHAPELIRLNYSGESVHYPHLIDAIRLAKNTGAQTELVSAFASISPALIPRVVESGLDRLTISLHTLDPHEYRSIYRYSTLDTLRSRIDDLLAAKRTLKKKVPLLDFAFVALRRNLSQLEPLASYAEQVGASQILVHPVLRRDPIPFNFAYEVSGGQMGFEFKNELRTAVRQVKKRSRVPITVSNPDVEPEVTLGSEAVYIPQELPEGARIRTCDQNPWETTHILANGDVVVCEVRDREVIGSLRSQTLAEIWTGAAYSGFRRRYLSGVVSTCRICPWKMAYRPKPLGPSISAADGMSPQLLRGWYSRDAAGTIWSKRESWAVLANLRGAGSVRVRGALPFSADGRDNVLEVESNGLLIGRVLNPTRQLLRFDAHFGPISEIDDSLNLRFVTRTSFNPSRCGINGDGRELGFALFRLDVVTNDGGRREV